MAVAQKTDGNPDGNPKGNQTELVGFNATGMPKNVFQLQYAEKELPPEQRKYDLDVVKTYINSAAQDPNYDLVDVMLNVENINGPKQELGEEFALRWKMNPDNNYYKKLYPNLSDENIESFRTIYNEYQKAYNGGYLKNIARYNMDNVEEYNPTQRILANAGINLNTVMTISPGLITPELSAVSNDYYIDQKGEYQYGRPIVKVRTQNGEEKNVYKATQIVQDPRDPNKYIFKELSDENKEATPNITNISLGSQNVYFTSDIGMRQIIKNGGKPFKYKKDGKEIISDDLAYDKEGRLVTTNKYLGLQHQYDPLERQTAIEYENILKEQGIDVSDIHNREFVKTYRAGYIISSKPQMENKAYNYTYGLWGTYERSLENSIPQIATYIQNIVSPSALSDDKYYKMLMNQHKTPIGIDASSPWEGHNIVKMIGDNTIQFLPSILLAPLTAGASMLPSILMTTGKTMFKSGLKTLAKASLRAGISMGKNGATVYFKKNAVKTALNDYVIKSIASLSFVGVAGGQSGWGQYTNSIQSGIEDSESILEGAKAMSLIAAGITILTSKLLEPSYIKPGFYMGLNKTIVNTTLRNMSKNAGVEMLTEQGKRQFGNKMFLSIVKSIQKDGMGGYGMRLGTDALFEGIQEFSESVFIGASEGIYNKYFSNPGSIIGNGKYDVAETFSNLGADFALGGLMGLGFGLNPISIVQGARNAMIRKQDTDDIMLYNQFNRIGVDKVLQESQKSIHNAWNKGHFDGVELDVNGDKITVNEKGEKVGATINIEGTTAQKFFGIKELKTMNDVRAYNMFNEVNRQAELYNEVKKNKIISDISADDLVKLDQKNIIVSNATKAYKNLQEKKERVKQLEGDLENAKTEGEQKVIKDELQILNTNDTRNDDTLASAQYKYDMWTMPMEEITTEELGQSSTYKYSKGVRDSIINNMLTINDAEILAVMKEDNIWKQLDTKQRKELTNKMSLFNDVGLMHSMFGEIDHSAYNETSKKSVLFGLGKVIHNYNEGEIKKVYTRDKMNEISSILERLSKLSISEYGIKERANVYSQMGEIMQQLRGVIGDSRVFAEAMALYNTDDTRSLVSSINASISDILSTKGREFRGSEEDLMELGIEQLVIDDKNQKELESNTGDYFGVLTESINEQEEIRRWKVDIFDIEGEEQQEMSQVLDQLAEKGIKAMIDDMPLSMINGNIPSQYKFRTIGQFMEFIERNKDTKFDKKEAMDISIALDTISSYLDKVNYYIATLGTIQEEASKNELYKIHTYINNITKRYLLQSEGIRNKINEYTNLLKEMSVNLVKNGFTRDKDNTRYLAATIANTNTYLEHLIGSRGYRKLLETIIDEDKNGQCSIDENAKGIKGMLAKQIISYFKSKGIEESEYSNHLKKMREDLKEMITIYDTYKDEVKELLKVLGPIQENEDPTLKNEWTINSILAELEMAYNSGEESNVKRITELKELLHKLNALQWETRNKLSGKLLLQLITNDVVGAEVSKGYQFMMEYNGPKLFEDKNSNEDDASTIYRGTYAPSEIEIGFTYIFSELATDKELLEWAKITAKQNNITITDDMSREDILKVLKQDENYILRKHSSYHMLTTNMEIDHYLGGNNMTVSDIFNTIDTITADRLINNSLFSTEEERKKASSLLVYKDDVIDIDESIKALKKYVAESNSDKKKLAQTIFSEIRMNINIEQEQVLIHMIANYYKNVNGDFGLGNNFLEHNIITPYNNSICVLGGGGTGKSTMIMENYYNIIRNITQKEVVKPDGTKGQKEGKIRILVLSPTNRITKQQVDIINNVFSEEEVEVVQDTFHNINDINDGFDIVVIDEASLISQEMNRKLRKKINKTNAKQVVFLYDNNQTINAFSDSQNITNTLGERTVPLESKFRTGLIDVHTLSEFFTSDDFKQYFKINNKQLRPLTNKLRAIETMFKITKYTNKDKTKTYNVLEGVKLTSKEKDIIDDYNNVKEYDNDVAIVVVSEEEKKRIVSEYNVNPDDVYILEYGDKNFNVSGIGSRNIFAIINFSSTLAEANEEGMESVEFAYDKISKWFNTALTRLKGNGYLTMLYPDSDNNSKELEQDDIIPKYNDVLNFDNANDSEVITIFEEQTRVELENANDVLDRHNKVKEKVSAKKTKRIKHQDPQEKQKPLKNELPQEQLLAENLSPIARDHVVRMKEKSLKNKNVDDISDYIYNSDGNKEISEDTFHEMAINDLLRFALAKIYNDVLENKYPIVNVTDSRYKDEIYNNVIDAFLKRTSKYSPEYLEWINSLSRAELSRIVNSMMEHSFGTTGIEMLSAINNNCAVISPVITGIVNGKEFASRPLMINAVGYVIEGKKKVPIFDVYIVDITREERGDTYPEGTLKRAMYAATMLAAQGYKVNKIHMLNYVKTNVTTPDGSIGLRVQFIKDNVLTKESLLESDLFNDVINDVKNEQKDKEILVEEDTLLKLGIRAVLTNEERLAMYTNTTTKKSSRIAYKTLRKEDNEIRLYYTLEDGSTILYDEFINNYTSDYVKPRNPRKIDNIVPGAIFSPIHAIPDFAITGTIKTDRKGFYGHEFFQKAKEAIKNIKAGDVVMMEYQDEVLFHYYDTNEKRAKTKTYRNVIFYKIGDQIVGIQERIRYANNAYENTEVDNLIAEYYKTGDEGILTQIKDILWQIEVKEDEKGEYPDKNKNINYTLQKIRMMRNDKPVIVSEVTGGNVVLGDPQRLDTLFNELGVKNAEWSYIDDSKNKFPLMASIKVDDKIVKVYVDADLVTEEYLDELSEQIETVRLQYESMFDKQTLADNENTKKLRISLESTEVVDFLYANRDSLRHLIPNLYDNKGITFKPKKGETYASIFANLRLAIQQARISIYSSKEGTDEFVFRKAIFKAGVKTQKTNDNIYLKNLTTKVNGVSIPAINVSVNDNININNTKSKKKKENNIEAKKDDIEKRDERFEQSQTQPKGTINVYWGQAESNTSTRILSNLAPRKFTWEGRKYGSVEHAYQTLKSGSFDKATYDAYNKIGGYGRKIRGKGTVAEMKAADSLGLMKKLVVESFKQNPNSEAAKKLIQYENFTHNTNELIDKAFLEGLKLAQKELLTNSQTTTQQKQKAQQIKTNKKDVQEKDVFENIDMLMGNDTEETIVDKQENTIESLLNDKGISIDEFNKKRDVFYNQFTDKGHIEIAGNKMTIEEFESKPIEEQINDIMCF